MIGALLGERLFSHTDNLSATLQKSNVSAVAGQNLAKQTVEILKRIRNDDSFNLFYDAVLERKKSLPDVGEPLLKRKTQAPARYFFCQASAEHPPTPRDHYQKIFFEEIDLLVGHIKDRFEQPSFQIFRRLESLLLDSLCKDVEYLDEEIQYIGTIYDEIDIQSLPAQLQLFRTMMEDRNPTCFNEIQTAVKT